MKKNLIYSVVTFFMIAFTFFSCNRADEKALTAKELNSSTVLSMSKAEDQGVMNRRGGGVGFAFDLGRRNASAEHGICPGFGICKLRVFWITIFWPTDERRNDYDYAGVITTKIDDETKYAAYVTFDAPVDTSITDTNFYVDEDISINSDDGDYIIKSGVYSLISSLGEYGGYEIAVERID